MMGVTAPHRFDVVGLSRHRQHVRRAETLADNRHDRQAWVVLQEKLTAAEELERSTAPQSDADARQKLINAAVEIRAVGPVYEGPDFADELMSLAKRRRITAA